MRETKSGLTRRGESMKTKSGIDVSKWQGKIDFAKVKDSGVEFVIIREGSGTNVDPMFFENVDKAESSGLPVVGVYHFCYATDLEGVRHEAAICIDNLKAAALIPSETYVFYDFEYDTVAKASKNSVTLGKEECIKFTQCFCDALRAAGYKSGFYTNLDYLNTMYDKEMPKLYELWLADYSGEPDVECAFHQHSCTGVIPGISGHVDLDTYFEKEENSPMPEYSRSRQKVVDLAKSWVGKNEADSSFKEIIDIYNSFTGKLPRGTKMDYSWAWCAATWSALAIKLGYTDIMPIEISCYYLIEAAKKMGCWVEDDRYVPNPGDGILYDWNDSGKDDNTGVPDHVGTVEYVSDGYIVVIEGNYSNEVKRRSILVNGKFIRGFITPNYTNEEEEVQPESTATTIEQLALEVITGLWGVMPNRKVALEKAGYDYATIQARVNEILNEPANKEPEQAEVPTVAYASSFNVKLAGTYTVAANGGLYMRIDAGTNKKAVTKLPDGLSVRCYGYYSVYKGVRWYLIEAKVGNTKYTGFCHSSYLKLAKPATVIV